MAKYSGSKYTSAVHDEFVGSLRQLTDNLLSEGVSDTTYAFGHRERDADAVVLERISQANPQVGRSNIDYIYKDLCNSNIDDALGIFASNKMTIPANVRRLDAVGGQGNHGIKHYVKHSATDEVNITIDSMLESYNVPANTRVHINAFKDAFREWEENKVTTLERPDHNSYFDETVIALRNKIDGTRDTVGLIDKIQQSFNGRAKLSAAIPDNGARTDVERIAGSIENVVKARGLENPQLAQFMSGFLHAVQHNKMTNFLNNRDTVALLGGSVKAITAAHELEPQWQKLRSLLTSSSQHAATVAIEEVKNRYDRVYGECMAKSFG